MKFEKYFILILLGVLILFAVALYTIYSEVKEQTIQDLNISQKIHARQAAAGSREYIDNVVSTLNFLSRFPEITESNVLGKRIITDYQTLRPEEVKGITRINAQGKIIFTVPFKELIGKDISQQDHVRQSMKTRKIVVSDVFMAIQGFRSVAVHVPVFKNGTFDGTIAFLLSFDKIAQITDVVLPGMNGGELKERLDAKYPSLQTLFTSGYNSDIVATRGVLEEGVHFLQKPFTSITLLKKVRQIINSGKK